ncbi:envelope glycoprotein L [Colobine gammaherpesvirus 1]|uniref:Envelope glycoprotein L n=1 Tax=Colobine gammaherpesvirus 1 TaxID=2597325 RepID=A0A5B8G7Y9_9GAMA|nr:envelope glycoprotein L [Colobine gammaherpesvirus 1]QDQ69254.1 envelope glycoprotein L [Colobine gammaherpesvirus 1]
MWVAPCILYLASTFWMLMGTRCPIKPVPCCAIYGLPEHRVPSIFTVSSIHLSDPQHCQGFCVAKLRSKNGSVTVDTCVNGFAVRSFLATVLQRLGTRASRDEQRLLQYVRRSLSEYTSTLNASTTNSSVLGLSLPRLIQNSRLPFIRLWRSG